MNGTAHKLPDPMRRAVAEAADAANFAPPADSAALQRQYAARMAELDRLGYDDANPDDIPASKIGMWAVYWFGAWGALYLIGRGVSALWGAL